MRPPQPPSNHATSLADEDFPSGTTPMVVGRKKGSGVRSWLLVDSRGEAEVEEVGKHAIMRRTGLPARDMRMLDPLLSYPSTLLGRERAIVINLEHIKAIITAHHLLMPNSKDPSLSPFIQDLQRKIIRHHHQLESQGAGENTDWGNLYDTQSREASPSNGEGEGVGDGEGLKLLPFEFAALEACLEAACSNLDNEARVLEQEAYPALDNLTSKITTLNLERVRQIKSRLVAITGRVQKVRDELEHLLDDDDDMAEMYLTDKLQQQLENSSASEQEAEIDDRVPAEIINGGSARFEEQLYGGLSKDSHGTHTSTTRSAICKLDVEELEMLLEAYFVQIDDTLNKLSTLKEYVDDTEDYINIILDDKQNHLLQMGVMLATATLIMSAFVVVIGIFSINVPIDLFDDTKSGMREFWWSVGGCIVGTIFLYVIAIGWYKHKGLLE